MPDVIGDLAPERKLGPVLGCEPAQRKNLPKRAAAEEDDEQDGKKEAWNRIARDDNGRGPDVEPRAVAHRLFDPKRDRDEVGEQRHPEPERDRHRQLLFDELQDGYIAEIRSPKIKPCVILKHQSEALIGGLVEAELLFEFSDELGVEPLGAPVFGRIIAPPCSAARRTPLPPPLRPPPPFSPPPPNRAVSPASAPCSCAIIRSTGPPGANCTMTKLISRIPNRVGIIKKMRRAI